MTKETREFLVNIIDELISSEAVGYEETGEAPLALPLLKAYKELRVDKSKGIERLAYTEMLKMRMESLGIK